jgi:hypothetical protein
MTAIRDIVPGGFLPTDHVHVHGNDNTCSRCRCEIDECEMPLMLWFGGGDRLLIFCWACMKKNGGEP